jgi:hypothetical protein
MGRFNGGGGGGHGFYRGGEGSGHKGRSGRNNNGFTRVSVRYKQKEMIFTIPNPTKSQASFQSVLDYICEIIQKTYKDRYEIAESLRKLQLKDFTAEEPSRRLPPE